MHLFAVDILIPTASALTFSKQVITLCTINHLKTKRRLLYLQTQSVPRCKHFSSRL